MMLYYYRSKAEKSLHSKIYNAIWANKHLYVTQFALNLITHQYKKKRIREGEIMLHEWVFRHFPIPTLLDNWYEMISMALYIIPYCPVRLKIW